MTTKCLVVVATAATLILSVPASPQTPSDLLQKGIHAQETAGDLDGAIAIFRQVASTASVNKSSAAQAQYQLVLCMLQKGDRAAAQKELTELERSFFDMPDLVAKARKLIPGTSALLPEPWGDHECEQLNIKRDGVASGEYLYYSAVAWAPTMDPQNLPSFRRDHPASPYLQAVTFQWELKTKKSTRSISITVDRDTRRFVDDSPRQNPEKPRYASDDDLGDALATPFNGPATDVEESVFLMRRLPLAVGYKTTIPVTSNAIAPTQLQLTVTGIESIETLAGKFNCYRVTFAGIGQTFWIGVEGKRPLVKFQSGGVQAELVRVWGPQTALEPLLATIRAAGLRVYLGPRMVVGGSEIANFSLPTDNRSFLATYVKRYIARAEIADVLQRAPVERAKEAHFDAFHDYKVRPESVQMRTIGGQQALSCLLDYTDDAKQLTIYAVWIRTEEGLLEIWADVNRAEVGVLRWRVDAVLAALRLP